MVIQVLYEKKYTKPVHEHHLQSPARGYPREGGNRMCLEDWYPTHIVLRMGFWGGSDGKLTLKRDIKIFKCCRIYILTLSDLLPLAHAPNSASCAIPVSGAMQMLKNVGNSGSFNNFTKNIPVRRICADR